MVSYFGIFNWGYFVNKKIINLDIFKYKRIEYENRLLALHRINNIWMDDQWRNEVRDCINWIFKNHKNINKTKNSHLISALMFFRNSPITEVRLKTHMLLTKETKEEAEIWDLR